MCLLTVNDLRVMAYPKVSGMSAAQSRPALHYPHLMQTIVPELFGGRAANTKRQIVMKLGGTPMSRGREFGVRLRTGCVCLAACVLLSACSLFRGSQTPEQKPDPFADGLLKSIGASAPANSPTQFLARIADDLGWEGQITQNTPLRKAVENREYEQVVMPFLLSLYYKNGFSVLPRVGEGHQFARNSVVRGVTGTSRLLVTSREPLKLIFLGPIENVQIVYPQDGQSPQIFTVSGTGVVAVRKSQLEQYLQ
jgi:hypothetical protein